MKEGSKEGNMSAKRKLARRKLSEEVIRLRKLEFIKSSKEENKMIPYIKQKGDKIKKSEISKSSVKVKRGNMNMGNVWRRRARADKFVDINIKRNEKAKKRFKFDKFAHTVLVKDRKKVMYG